MIKQALIAAIAFTIPLAAMPLATTTGKALAKPPRSTNMLRDAITAITPLKDDGKTILSGESDGDEVIASLTLGESGDISALSVVQADAALRLPSDSWNTVKGSKIAWLEERGALTTLVIEGEDDNGDWRLALIFHSEQLRQRRLSVEGQKRDLFTFYSRDDEMRPTESKRRAAHGRGLYNH